MAMMAMSAAPTVVRRNMFILQGTYRWEVSDRGGVYTKVDCRAGQRSVRAASIRRAEERAGDDECRREQRSLGPAAEHLVAESPRQREKHRHVSGERARKGGGGSASMPPSQPCSRRRVE